MPFYWVELNHRPPHEFQTQSSKYNLRIIGKSLINNETSSSFVFAKGE